MGGQVCASGGGHASHVPVAERQFGSDDPDERPMTPKVLLEAGVVAAGAALD
jgi:hypothetical protein